jgi:hypothetical protein
LSAHWDIHGLLKKNEPDGIIFIRSVFKLLFMIRWHIPVVLLVFFLLAVPVSANLNKIASGAPVFIGESNLDISSALNGHSVIAWWPDGADMSQTPGKTITISREDMTKFSLTPTVFTGCAGKWYSYDTAPNIFVFEVLDPQIDLKVWDLDNGKDVTGQTLPMSANVTYRIDTNLYQALNYVSRPNYNPSDSFFTVKLTNPLGIAVTQIYTGNLGGTNTQILTFDNKPFVNTATYYWKNGVDWDRNAKNADGSALYTPGTYTFSASQDLNHMSDSYSTSSADSLVGKLTTGDKTITFVKDTYATTPAITSPMTPAPSLTLTGLPTTATTSQPSIQPTDTTLPVKTTFTPLPAWIVFAGIGSAALVFAIRRKY